METMNADAACAAATPAEQRDDRRLSTLKKGHVIFNNGHCVVECTIRNISETGAGLELPCFVELPATVTLSIPGGPKRDCEVVWAANTKLGVRFCRPSAATATNGPRSALLARVRSIQDQLDALRADIEKTIPF